MSDTELDLAAGLILARISATTNKLEYLLLQMKGRHWNWGPPKGYLEPSENDLEGAQRETTEETGLIPQDYEVYQEFQILLKYKARGRPKLVKYWPALLKNPETPIKISHEHQHFRWLSIAEAYEFAFGQDMKKELLNCDSFFRTKLKV